IDVYFSAVPLNPAAATNPSYYHLINTATNVLQVPSSVVYDSVNNVAHLTFASNLAATTYHLQVGTNPVPSNTLSSAVNLGTLFNTNTFNGTGLIGNVAGVNDV